MIISLKLVDPRDKKRRISMSGCPSFNQFPLYFNNRDYKSAFIVAGQPLFRHRTILYRFTWLIACRSQIYDLATGQEQPPLLPSGGAYPAFGLMSHGEITGVCNKTLL